MSQSGIINNDTSNMIKDPDDWTTGDEEMTGAQRSYLQTLADEESIPLIAPPPELCTDNGAMIAWAGAERLALGMTDALDAAPKARWPLDEVAAARGRKLNTAAYK